MISFGSNGRVGSVGLGRTQSFDMEGQIRNVFLEWIRARVTDGLRMLAVEFPSILYAEQFVERLGWTAVCVILFIFVCSIRVSFNVASRGWFQWIEWMVFGSMIWLMIMFLVVMIMY